MYNKKRDESQEKDIVVESFSQTNEKEIIIKILLDSSIIINSDNLLYEWDEMVREDNNFLNTNKFLINLLHENIMNTISDKWSIVGLLKIFLQQNFLLEEVLNTLFMINNTLKHLFYFDKIFTKNHYSSEPRGIDDYLTESYFNINNKFFFLLNNYKTKLSERGIINSGNSEDNMYYKDFSDKRREIFFDKHCKIILNIRLFQLHQLHLSIYLP